MDFGPIRPRGIAAALGLCAALAGPATAGPGGTVTLANGAAVGWSVPEGEASPALALAVPAFAVWARGGFAQAVVVEMRSDALAAIEAWEVGFYRLGDTDFSHPLWSRRGTARDLDRPLRWDGRVADGPSLRPGETVVARLTVRDVAGNTGRTASQEMLVARYRMARERKALAKEDAARKRALATGEALRLPLHGRGLTLTVTGWPGATGPGASGARFRAAGDAWVLRQTLPPGPHEIVIESRRPIMGGTRAVPVGVVPVVLPPLPPYRARIKGTGSLDKAPPYPGLAAPAGMAVEAVVPGAQALGRVLTDRESAQDRLALALVDPDAAIPLAVDGTMRRALLTARVGGAAAWPGGTGTGRAPDPAPGRRTIVRFPAPAGGELFLPHTDIEAGNLRLSLDDDGPPPVPERDYFVNADEGRVLLGAAVRDRLTTGRVLTADYVVPAFAAVRGAGMTVPHGGAAHDRRWDGRRTGGTVPTAPAAAPGAAARVMRWLLGDG